MYQNLHHLFMQLILFQKVKSLELFTKLLPIYLLSHIYFLLIHQILSHCFHLLLNFDHLVIFWLSSFSFLIPNHHQDLMITLLFLLLYFHELVCYHLFIIYRHGVLNQYVFLHHLSHLYFHLSHFISYFMMDFVNVLNFFLLDAQSNYLNYYFDHFHHFKHLLAIKHFISKLHFNVNYFLF